MALAETRPHIHERAPLLKRAATGHRFLLLFVFLLAYVVAYPYLEGQSGYYMYRLLTGLLLALSIYAISFRRSLAIAALVLAIPTASQRIFHPMMSPGLLSVVTLILSF